MNTIFHFTGAELEVVIRNLQVLIESCELRDEPPEIAFFKDPMLNQKVLKQALAFYNEQWYEHKQNGKITIITDAKFYGPGLPHYPFTDYHLVTKDIIRKFYKNTTVRLIVEEDKVDKVYDYVNAMVNMGYTSFFVQRDKVPSAERNEAYCKELNSQWSTIIDELLNKRRLRLDLTLQMPEEQFDKEDYYFYLHEEARYILANGEHEMNQMIVQQKKESMTMPIIMTESCNLNCSYCYVTERGKMNYNIITDETIKNLPTLVTKMLEEYEKVQLDLFGGEPLLQWGKCKEIIEIIEPLWQQNKDSVSIRILTNATLLTQKKLDYARTKRFVDFHISRDGDEESHNKTRVYKDGSGSYADVKKNIDLYLETYKKNAHAVELNFVISPDNVAEFYDSIVVYYEQGYKRFDINVVKEDVWTDESIEVYKEQYAKVMEFVIDKIENNIMFYSKQMMEPYALKSKTQSLCPAATAMVGVSPDGKLYPCQRFFNNKSGFVIGTVKDGIDESSEIYQKIVNFKHSKQPKCVGCECEGVCHQHCFAAQWEIGQLFTYIDSNCTINKYNMRMATMMFERLCGNQLFDRLVPTIFCTKCC